MNLRINKLWKERAKENFALSSRIESTYMIGTKMMDELFEIYKRNFPFIVRGKATVYDILRNANNIIIDRRNDKGELIGVSIINGNTILLLCVDQKYRSQGIGSELLTISESTIRDNGHNEVVVGAGVDYLMPGVPTCKRYFPSVNEKLYHNIDEVACEFFTKRGYRHSWDCNCFDMRFSLADYKDAGCSIGDTIDGITYRWATSADTEKVYSCTDDAFEEFTQWYKNETLYDGNDREKVLIATDHDEVVGTLIVSLEAECENLGSVGCTAVKNSFQGRHIATNLVILGTKYLKDAGMKEAYLGYTYSGLDRLYGYAGYKICVYYMMATKDLSGK